MRMRRPGLTQEHVGQKLSMLSCGALRGYNDSERKTRSRDAQRHKKATVGITALHDHRFALAVLRLLRALDLSDDKSAADVPPAFLVRCLASWHRFSLLASGFPVGNNMQVWRARRGHADSDDLRHHLQ